MNKEQIESLAESGEMYSCTVEITPEKARKLIEMQPRNRKPIPRKIEQYAQIMVSGKWSASHPQGLIFNKQAELIDGQHRLLAVIKANTPVSFYCTFNAEQESQLLLDTATPRRLDQTAQIMGMDASPSKIAIAKVLLIKIEDTKINRYPDPNLIFDIFRKYEDAITFASQKTDRMGVTHAFVRGAIARAYYHADITKLQHFIEVLDSGFSTEASDNGIIALRNFCLTKKINNDKQKLSAYRKSLNVLDGFLRGTSNKNLVEAKNQPFLLEIDNA